MRNKTSILIYQAQNINPLDSLSAPTTYAKQDKQQGDSKIEYFKHDDYHNVKCISRGVGYRDNRWTQIWWFYPEVHFQWIYVSVEEVQCHNAPRTPQMAQLEVWWLDTHPMPQKASPQSCGGTLHTDVTKGLPYSPVYAPQMRVHNPLWDTWGRSPNPYKACSNLHNSIRGS